MKMYKLLGADGKIYESETPGEYGGNGRDKIYGRLDCGMALLSMRRFPGEYQKHRVFFADEKTPLRLDSGPAVVASVRSIMNGMPIRRHIVRSLDYNVE